MSAGILPKSPFVRSLLAQADHMNRAAHEAAHPHFPFLTAGDVPAVAALLARLGWLEEGEQVVACDRAGPGNMNLTLRVVTDRRTAVLKQARPWVEKYEQIDAPWDRGIFECRFYERVAGLREVADRMPRLLAADERARVLWLEHLPEASDYSSLYGGGQLAPDEVAALARWLRALHGGTRGAVEPQFANRAMRVLNHQHLCEVPLTSHGLALEALEPGLEAAAARLRDDRAYVDAVAEVGRRYLADGTCLVHGDYFPGSWLRTPAGPRIIDPEFCFWGPPEWDVGCAVAHLVLARQPQVRIEQFMRDYGEGLDMSWVARFAAVEVMRRVIGVAQLPIPPSTHQRAAWLAGSRAALESATVERLYDTAPEG